VRDVFVDDDVLDVLVERLDGAQGGFAMGAAGVERHVDDLVEVIGDGFPSGRVTGFATRFAVRLGVAIFVFAAERCGGRRAVLRLESAQAIVEVGVLDAQGGVFVEELFVAKRELFELKRELFVLEAEALDDGDEDVRLRAQLGEKFLGKRHVHEQGEQGRRRGRESRRF